MHPLLHDEDSSSFSYGTGSFDGIVNYDKMIIGPFTVNPQKFTRIVNVTSDIVRITFYSNEQ